MSGTGYPGDPSLTRAAARTTVPDRARVVIVGGGVIGTSIAYHLTRLGWHDIVLLERDRLTSGTTWHAAGLITSAGMVDETALFMSRYSRDLYERLEEETGLSTGFRPVGHISIATSPHRMEALRRESLFVQGFGVEDHALSGEEIADLWPLLKTDDVVGGFVVADEGRADPVGVAMSLARGARMGGATILEG
ncbi:MAG TPA: FAD-dependent oxidoreductase, partial [Acidimicrobiales bacterium]|nr:FAD-dependent oxidoreductase [Acidimicrobiales bacterium]